MAHALRTAVPIAVVLGLLAAITQTPLFGLAVAVVAIASHLAGEAFHARKGRPPVPAPVALIGAGVLAFVLVVLLA